MPQMPGGPSFPGRPRTPTAPVNYQIRKAVKDVFLPTLIDATQKTVDGFWECFHINDAGKTLLQTCICTSHKHARVNYKTIVTLMINRQVCQ
jgi:hypothetical protein